METRTFVLYNLREKKYVIKLKMTFYCVIWKFLCNKNNF